MFASPEGGVPAPVAATHEGGDEGRKSARRSISARSREHCTKYVQFGNIFSLFHAVALFMSEHHKLIGVCGVSDKHDRRSWAPYSALWSLTHVLLLWTKNLAR